MNDIEWKLLQKKHDELRLVNVDGVINLGPCHVSGVTIAADNANGDCDIYDGTDKNGEKKIHLEALSGTSFNWPSTHGAPFRKGIYVVVNASTTNVMITFHLDEFPEGRG